MQGLHPPSPGLPPPGEGESFAARLKIYMTGLAGRSSAKPEIVDSCFLSWGRRIRGEGERKYSIQELRSKLRSKIPSWTTANFAFNFLWTNNFAGLRIISVKKAGLSCRRGTAFITG